MRKLLLTASLLVPAAANAGGYTVPDANARTLALSQADLADQTGAEALLLNPAAMANQVGLDISLSGQWLDNRTTWSDPTLGTAKTKFHFNSPIAGAVAWGDTLPHGMAYGAGVGISTPDGGAIYWPVGWPGQESVETVNQKVYQITAGGAFAPLKYLSVGVNYVRYQGTEELHQAINFIDHYGDAGLGLSGGANTFMVSGQGRLPWLPLQLAVSFKYRAQADVSGNVHFTGVPASFTTLLHDQDVTSNIRIPSELHAGAAYEVYKNLSVMFTFTNEFWSIYHADTFIGSSGFTVTVPRNYRDAQVYRFGAEWARTPFLPGLSLRVGAVRSESNQPSDTLSPSLTDASSTAFSLGAGYEVIRNLRIDLGYQHAFFDAVTASGMDTLPGTYKTQVDLLSLGINWRLDLLGRGLGG